MTLINDKKSIDYLADYIKSNLITKEYFKPNRIFLCGGSIFDKNTMRFKIQRYLIDRQKTFPTSSRYEISYPEDLFDELLMSKKYDLLSLESLLADSVDIIIIVVESAGSIAELGAFVNDKKLIKKTMAINSKENKKKRSFINQGPIKLLKKTNSNSVIYLDFENPDFSLLPKSIRTIISNTEITTNDLTLLNIDTFILPLLYITGSLDIQTINKMVQVVVHNKDFYEQITSSCLASMVKNKLLEKKNNNYNLSKIGFDKFNNTMFYRNKNKIDEIRLKYLNLLYRGKKLVS